PVAKGERSNFADGRVRSGNFILELFTVTLKPHMYGVLGGLPAFREEQREVIGDGFVDPLIPVAGPSDYVAPPLMGDFMIRDNFGKRFLPRGRETSTALRFGGQERKCRDV